jgi:hypothetical protein
MSRSERRTPTTVEPPHIARASGEAANSTRTRLAVARTFPAMPRIPGALPTPGVSAAVAGLDPHDGESPAGAGLVHGTETVVRTPHPSIPARRNPLPPRLFRRADARHRGRTTPTGEKGTIRSGPSLDGARSSRNTGLRGFRRSRSRRVWRGRSAHLRTKGSPPDSANSVGPLRTAGGRVPFRTLSSEQDVRGRRIPATNQISADSWNPAGRAQCTSGSR